MERRKHPRFKVDLPVRFSKEHWSAQGRVIDISLGGCRVNSKAAVFTGDCLSMEISLPDSQPELTVELAVVRWSIGQQFGVEFVRMWPDEQSRLDQFAQRLAAD